MTHVHSDFFLEDVQICDILVFLKESLSVFRIPVICRFVAPLSTNYILLRINGLYARFFWAKVLVRLNSYMHVYYL
jgi:hypothetical protein